jgi:hypothetical protein
LRYILRIDHLSTVEVRPRGLQWPLRPATK